MKITPNDIRAMKGREKIAALTAYDYPMAKLLDEAGFAKEKIVRIYNGIECSRFNGGSAGRLRSELGWSNGATSVLWTVRPRAAAKDDTPDFRSAVAFYPGCSRLENTAWSARVPTLILIGAADDWTAAQPCERMVAGARGRSARASIVVYPGAYHDFDHPNRPFQVRTGVAFSADGHGRVHTGTNPAARADALRRVPQWLAR